MAMNVRSGKDSETMNTNIDIDDMGLEELYDLLEKIEEDLRAKDEEIRGLVPISWSHPPAYDYPYEPVFWKDYLDSRSDGDVKLRKAREIRAEAQMVLFLKDRVVTRVIRLEKNEQAKRQN